jgi:polyribonucleotide 5'-hydroxyl-kinase
VDRDESYMKQYRQAQIRAYFFGHDKENALAPHSQMADISDMNIFKIADGKCVDFNFLYQAERNRL